jgi:predicted house-cleaning noncanonical NTP pyrophosphatase (MazG superfamily)
MTANSNLRSESSKKHREKLPTRKLAPLSAVTCIDSSGIVTLSSELVRMEEVGWKAFGLSSVPCEWVPKFLVINADCFKDANAEQKLHAVLKQGMAKAGVSGAVVMLRSSGTAETIHYRGRLISGTCLSNEIVATVKNWIATLPNSIPGKVHWLVQEYVQPMRQGHLSNERRVSKEKRDWVAELELKEGVPGYSIPIAVRRWRDGDRMSDSSLNCTAELEISFCLKRVAMWAERLVSRMHFEWVWNGNAIRVVQADIADSVSGVDPHSLVPSEVSRVFIESLTAFKAATTEQYGRFAKLRNAKLYQEFGYVMPTFYVLDDVQELTAILGGTLSDTVERDLAELTKRPLILRTDGTDIPADKREMLPRSEHLRTVDEARAWLLGSFKAVVEQSELQKSSLCLIGHHFIPSVASAWARAEPGKRLVRIESLWGLPEGLYWYSHDTYEVDTQDVVIEPAKPSDNLKYELWERLRYKGTFIAPDLAGKWIPFETQAPFDWRSSINKRHWLFEIARTTRLIAENEKYPLAVMWFIGNHAAATSHSVLPWFHSRSELEEAPKAAPRRKLSMVGDHRLRDSSDWESLKQQVAVGKRVERVIVEPTDCDLVRNAEFARELAVFAASNNIVIELAGGVLSHAYYILHLHGAQVECTDLFGANEDVVEYNKLVRDKIPAIIERRGERVELAKLSGDALTSALRQKLVEEALEALDAKSGDDLIAELADVEEVISGLRHALKVSKAQIEAERLDKLKRRGGFQQGFMLTRTSTPHSLQKQADVKEATLGLESGAQRNVVISRSEDIPSTPIYRRPDLRQIEQEIEKLFVFQTEIRKSTSLAQTVNFTLPIDSGSPREFSLTVELRRERSSIRSSIRLRVRPSQLEINFPDFQLKFEF